MEGTELRSQVRRHPVLGRSKDSGEVGEGLKPPVSKTGAGDRLGTDHPPAAGSNPVLSANPLYRTSASVGNGMFGGTVVPVAGATTVLPLLSLLRTKLSPVSDARVWCYPRKTNP